MKFIKNKKYLVAVSGGVDSIVLLDILSKQKLDINVIHVNHCIREEADADEEFVKLLTKSYGFNFFSKKIDIPGISENKNVEMVAREERYKFFYETLDKYNFNYLVLGHNQNEQAETIFLNILRGVSVSALKGMQTINEDAKILRPLLDWNKQKIINYAKDNNLTWVEDKTNEDIKYDRNWIRHIIFPELSKRRNIIKNLSQKANYFKNLENFLNEEGNKLFNEVYQDNKINVDLLQNKSPILVGEFLKILYKRLHNTEQGFKSNFVNEFTKFVIDNKPMNGQYISFEDHIFTFKNSFISISKKLEKTNEFYL
jgi:tRNA(Ile)-lysidine synthase